MSDKKQADPSTVFALEYVSSAVSLLANDGIVVHVVNDSAVSENARVVIYQATGGGATPVSDSGSMTAPPSFDSGVGFTVAASGEYWVRIQVTSEAQVPMASFERLASGTFVPFVTYEPGDFAAFSLIRKRIW